MSKFRQVWKSLRDEEYRREYSADVGTGLAFQIRFLREKNGWSQEQLAQRTGKQQETISQWENPDYGRYTLNSLRSLAHAFDVALLVRFAPFSELVDWTVSLTPQRLAPPSFSEEERRGVLREGSYSGAFVAADAGWDTLLEHQRPDASIAWVLSSPANDEGITIRRQEAGYVRAA